VSEKRVDQQNNSDYTRRGDQNRLVDGKKVRGCNAAARSAARSVERNVSIDGRLLPLLLPEGSKMDADGDGSFIFVIRTPRSGAAPMRCSSGAAATPCPPVAAVKRADRT
jgi:hypothetical protein